MSLKFHLEKLALKILVEIIENKLDDTKVSVLGWQ
jgi:hypothetical protein